MHTINTIEQIRKNVSLARKAGKTIGLVPTMGALHKGHISLIQACRSQCNFVIVSIFVNPTQFGPGEDYEKYPRNLQADEQICSNEGADVIFAPSVNEMYRKHNLTWVSVEELTENLCGRCRPVHFRGVTTVCTKLFNIVCPDYAFFGQKDAQQAIVIKRMAADLNMPLKIVICPTVRDTDGLAVSSRNEYLSEPERKQATLIYKALQNCEQMIDQNCRKSSKLIAKMTEILSGGKDVEIEYISITDAELLKDIDTIDNKALVAIAVKIGRTRLIDNILVDLSKL